MSATTDAPAGYDVAAVETWIRGHVRELAPPFAWTRLPGGHSNLTYLIEDAAGRRAVIRGGAFKPRSSPYSFQGLGEEGLRLLREAADRRGLLVVSEVMDSAQIPLVAA